MWSKVMNKLTAEGINKGLCLIKQCVLQPSMFWQAFNYLPLFLTLSFVFRLSSPCSSSSKQRKNVISCVTVHDSPESDCSSNNSPYAVESRPPNNNSYDTKTTILDNYNNGNPRTIIIPPLKTQSNEVPSECERLMPGEQTPPLHPESHPFAFWGLPRSVPQWFKQAALPFSQMQRTIRIQHTSSSPPMESCRAIITYPGVWLEAGPTDSSPQGHTPSSSSSPSISARYLKMSLLTSTGINFCNGIGHSLLPNF